jgi:hypothetical protein
MPPLDFPNAPTTGTTYTFGGVVWQWDGVKWVALGSGAGTAVPIGPIAPAVPVNGSEWWDTVSGQLFVYVDDGTSKQWVVAVNQAAGVGEAPTDGRLYGRASLAWSPVPAVITNDVGRNKLHNPLFNIQQYGTQGTSISGVVGQTVMVIDRWSLQLGAAGDVASFGQYAYSAAGLAQIGDEEQQHCLQLYLSGASAAAGGYVILEQRLESVARLSNKTITVSFWANNVGGAASVGVGLVQNFGTGGSPYPPVRINGVKFAVPTTGWARYSTTFTLPTMTTQGFGTNRGTDYTGLQFCFSAGSNLSSSFGNIGVQTAVQLQFWGIQLEVGSVATPLEKLDPRMDLANCQRFYQTGNYNFQGYNTAAGNAVQTFNFAVVMRAPPTIVNNVISSNVSSGNLSPGAQYLAVTATAAATGEFYYIGTFTASADL